MSEEKARNSTRSQVGALIKGERNGIKQTWTGVVLTALSWLDLTGREISGVELKRLKIAFCYTPTIYHDKLFFFFYVSLLFIYTARNNKDSTVFVQ